jgi:hypothetical protein
MTTRRAVSGDQYFYFIMSLLITAIVIYGFSHTVNQNLIHPDLPRPWILWIHGALFSVWLLFFILQSALIRTRNVRVHRSLGWLGAAMGPAIIVVGLSTSIIMARYEIRYHHATDAAAFLIVRFLDLTCFALAFALAIYWRRKPEYHRRLMLALVLCRGGSVDRHRYRARSDREPRASCLSLRAARADRGADLRCASLHHGRPGMGKHRQRHSALSTFVAYVGQVDTACLTHRQKNHSSSQRIENSLRYSSADGSLPAETRGHVPYAGLKSERCASKNLSFSAL